MKNFLIYSLAFFKMSILLFLFVMAPPSFANGETLIKPLPDVVMVNELFKLEPIEGHHFNYDAPHECGEKNFIDKKPMSASCQITSHGKKLLKIGVCDDAKTFCRIEKLEVLVLGNDGGFWQKVKSWFGAGKEKSGLKKESKHFEGWIVNDPKKALEVSRKTGKPLYIDFTAIWCPPCNELEDHVFNQKEFMKVSDSLVRVKLDADFKISNEWKNHFRVGGYPTIVVADSDLNEIGRIVGFYALPQMKNWIKEMQKLSREPINQAEKVAKADWGKEFTRRLRVGKWYLERKEFKKAMEFLDGLQAGRKDYLLSKLAFEKSKKNKKSITAVLIQLVDEFSHFEIAEWTLELLDVDKKEGSKRLDKSLVAVEASLRSGDYAKLGWKRGDLFVIKAILFEKLGNMDAAKSAYLQCAGENSNWQLKSSAKIGSSGIKRGAAMDYAYCIKKAGDSDKALKVYKKLVAVYPSEFTFNFNLSRILMGMSKNEQAYVYALKAYEASYGDNRLRATHLKATLEINLNRKMDAKNTLSLALSNTKLPKQVHVRTHNYYSRLRNLYDKNFKNM